MDLKTTINTILIRFREASATILKQISGKIREIIVSPGFKNTIRISGKIVLYFFSVLFLYFILVSFSPALQEYSFRFVHPEKKELAVNEKTLVKKMKQLESTNKQLARKLEMKTPQQPYIIINSTQNEFRLFKGKKMIREGVCSTGSYIMLKAADERKWIFQTPRGVFRIQGKTTSPVWIKPDWAFIEEGLPVPATNSNLRYEYGVLGDYALSLGHGYLIHGTLYQRFLGLPVTHGCIRLGDDDLKEVYRTLDISSKVFIY